MAGFQPLAAKFFDGLLIETDLSANACIFARLGRTCRIVALPPQVGTPDPAAGSIPGSRGCQRSCAQAAAATKTSRPEKRNQLFEWLLCSFFQVP